MKRKNNKNSGFTLIEMVVVTAITAMLAMMSITNFRAAEKRKRVALATDGIVSVLNLAQTYTTSGKNTNNTQANCRVPQYYYVEFQYTNTYSLYALDNCGETDLIENYTLPQNIRIQASSLTMNGVTATTRMRVAYYLPFSQIRGALDVSANNAFTTALITVETSDGSISRTTTINGVTGRIEQ